MLRISSRSRALWIGLACLVFSSSARADEMENFKKLQAMPRERRIALAENLERFDKLDSTEQAAIRKLDAQIAAKDPIEQARYRALLRRYHLWVNGLTLEQKKELAAATTPEARFAQARTFRIKQIQEGSSEIRLAGIRTGDFGLVAPYEMAHLLKVWFKLSPVKKAEVEKQPQRKGVFAAIRKEASAHGVRFEPFPATEEATYTARFSGDGPLKQMLATTVKFWSDPVLRKGEKAKEADPNRRFEHPIAEFLYFAQNRPYPVNEKNLERFSERCPGWLHAMTDPLAPDDAREYFTILYRLIYPNPLEIPAEAKAAAPPTPPPSSPRKTAGANPL